MSDEFYWGGLLGGTVMWVFWTITDILYRNILIRKATEKNRTAEKIGDGFYYIVPEAEYVRKLADY